MPSCCSDIEREIQIPESELLTVCERDSSLSVQHNAKATTRKRVKLLILKHPRAVFGLALFKGANIIHIFKW